MPDQPEPSDERPTVTIAPADGQRPRAPDYGEFLDYGNGVIIRRTTHHAPRPSEVTEITYDEIPPFHPDEIAAIRKRLGLPDTNEDQT